MSRGKHNPGPRVAALASGVLLGAWLAAACAPPPPPPLEYREQIAVDDGDASTDDRGYASSRVNATAYRMEALRSVGQQQFAAYYHHDTSVVIARRTLGSRRWEIFKQSQYKTSGLSNNHCVISFGIDGDGVLHISWGMHGGKLRYARSVGPVTGQAAIQIGANEQGMTRTPDGQFNEHQVSYPQFIHLPDGDLLFAYRSGITGDADYHLNRFDTGSDSWSVVAGPWIARQPARTSGLTVSAYLNRPVLGPRGNLHVSWTWRGGTARHPNQGGVEMNHDLLYAWSADAGRTWRQQGGQACTLPITEVTGQTALTIPRYSSLGNQAGMAIDSQGHPLVANWWAHNAQGGDYRRQYMVAWYDGARWKTSRITHRTVDSKYVRPNVDQLKTMSRPMALVGPSDRALLVYRDNEDTNGVTVVYSEPGERGGWDRFDLTSDDLGIYEPIHDPVRWQRDGVLSLLVQPIGPGRQTEPLTVVEWDARRFFADWAALH